MNFIILTLFWISACLICYAYIFYPAILLLFKQRVNASHQVAKYEPTVSFVINAYNEEKVIASKIENLIEVDYPKGKLEIVIASDGSDDRTDSIISKYASSGVKLIRIDERRGKINALNTVIPKLRGDIVVLSDANTFYESDAIKKLVRNFKDSKIGCVCGELRYRNLKENEVESLEGFYWRYEQFLKKIEGKKGALLGANGGIYAIRKELFEPLPANTIVEDFVLPMKILEKGYKVVYESEAVAYEETSKKIVQEMERRIRIGAGDFQALSFTWKMLNPRHGFAAFAYLSHKVIRWFVPFFLIITFTSNLALLDKGFYSILFILQCMFYALAILGRTLSKLNMRIKMTGLPYYFISMNLALFLGFIRFCTNSQSVTWRRTER